MRPSQLPCPTDALRRVVVQGDDFLDVVDGIWPDKWSVRGQMWPDCWTVVHDGIPISEDVSNHPFIQQLARRYPPPPEEDLEPIVEIQVPEHQPTEPWPQVLWPNMVNALDRFVDQPLPPSAPVIH